MPLFGTRGAASVTGFGGLAKLGYLLRNSLRFRASNDAYLSRTPASAGNQRTWTWSGWVKRGVLGSASTLISGGGTTGRIALFFNSSDQLEIDVGGTGSFQNSTAVFRDPAAWYHVVWAFDTTQGTGANRSRIYVNGTELSLTQTRTFTQNTDYAINGTGIQTHGTLSNSIGGYDFDGYLTEINFVNAQQLTPSSFAKTDAVTGQWIPIKFGGAYGTNGFYLKFDDSSAIGKDSSGNGNNWSTSGHSVTPGATYDLMTDVPTLTNATTANYATLNPLDSLGGTFSNGNLEYSGTYTSGGVSINGHGCRSTLKVPSSGKWYAEASGVNLSGAGNSCMLGFTSSTQAITAGAFAGTLTPWIGVDASIFNNRLKLNWNGVSGGTASDTQLFASYASGDIVNFAIDFSAGKIWIGKNGTYYNSGNPAAGTNETSTFTAGSLDWAFWGEYVASGDDGNRSGVVANFGQRPFAYSAPSGFKSLNTFNLP